MNNSLDIPGVLDYIAKAVTKPRKTKIKRVRKGIMVPTVSRVNTGILAVKTPEGPRYRVWFTHDTRKRYVTLPKGICIEEARERRDRLYARLKADHGAKSRKPLKSEVDRAPYNPRMTPLKFIYKRQGYRVTIRGKHIGLAWTEEEAVSLRDAWLKENGGKL